MAGYPVAGLFAGIGGIEAGLAASGHHSVLLCENHEPAIQVLGSRFGDVPMVGDIRTLRSLPHEAELVSAGFPCQDLSQAGQTAGISGARSGLIGEVFRLLRRRHPTWLLLENVQFMLHLDSGRAMRYLVDELTAMKYRWAYRIVDSRFTGVPQRRRRVILLASRTEDPRSVLFFDDAGQPADDRYRADAFGFYWTEGLRGLGWAVDAVPTLKGGSSVGIPSPPAVWRPHSDVGRKFVTPVIEDAERLQGFEVGWTAPAADGRRGAARWKLVGNAVTVGVARWVGMRLSEPKAFDAESRVLEQGAAWPTAAWGDRTGTWRVSASEFPRHEPYLHLSDLADLDTAPALSARAAAGFLERAERSTLRFLPGFLEDVAEHVEFQRGQRLPMSA